MEFIYLLYSVSVLLYIAYNLGNYAGNHDQILDFLGRIPFCQISN